MTNCTAENAIPTLSIIKITLALNRRRRGLKELKNMRLNVDKTKALLDLKKAWTEQLCLSEHPCCSLNCLVDQKFNT